MNLFENMDTFVKIVDLQSMSAAADRLGIAKSVVSRRLKDLESHLGAELFRRTTRQLVLTDTGHAYYLRSVQILEDVLETEHSISRKHKELKGKLRIALPATFGNMHVAPLLNEFLDLHPEIDFDLHFSDREVDLVEEGFDLALRISKLEDSTLIARKITNIKRVFCASPTYLEKRGIPDSPVSMSTHCALTYSHDRVRDSWVFFDSNGQELNIKLRPTIRSNSGEYLRDAAVAGKGITFLPAFIIYRELNEGSLIPILMNYSTPTVNLYAVYPQTRHLSSRVRTFIDFIVQHCSDTPYWDEPLNKYDS